MYENFLPLISAMENDEEVTLDRQGVTGFMNCLKKSVMLVGDVAAIFTTRRREQVLSKLNPSLASLGKEEFPESGKQLFGDGFESRLKDRSETARTVAVAHFFSEVCFPGRARPPSRQFYAEPAQTIFPKVPENQVYIQPVLYSSVPTPTISDSSKPGKGKGQLLIKPVLKAKPVPPPGMYLNPIKINCPIAGRLKHFLPNREQITQDPWIRQVVGDPSPGFSTKENDRKCRESTANRERSAKTGDKAEKGFLSTLFLLPKKGGEQRPVVNLKPLYQMIPYKHFKMEGSHMLKDLLKKGDYLVKVDLKDAYMTVSIWHKHKNISDSFGKTTCGSLHASHLVLQVRPGHSPSYSSQ